MGVFVSDLSGKKFPVGQKVSGRDVKSSILQKIKEAHPQFTEDHCLSVSELNDYRNQYIQSSLQQEMGSLSQLEHEVLDALRKNILISENIEETVNERLTIGQRMADKIASFGGSWKFITFFMTFLFGWIAVNLYFLTQPFDAYPFILLNLILSCIAALQAPVIMMSQNRQEEKDRERSKHDYQVNLKAELEIRMLNEKIDHLIQHQQQRLFEMQQIQVEMLKEIDERLSQKKSKQDQS